MRGSVSTSNSSAISFLGLFDALPRLVILDLHHEGFALLERPAFAGRPATSYSQDHLPDRLENLAGDVFRGKFLEEPLDELVLAGVATQLQFGEQPLRPHRLSWAIMGANCCFRSVCAGNSLTMSSSAARESSYRWLCQ